MRLIDRIIKDMGMHQETLDDMVLQRETEARRAGVPQRDIDLSRRCGIDAMDVRIFREFSKGLLIVVRCPPIEARAYHGYLPPKPLSASNVRSGESGLPGVVVIRSDKRSDKRFWGYVSDYDLMSIWRQGGSGWRKVFASAANGAPRGRYSAEATTIIIGLNRSLVSRIQHGCQDDYCSPKNRGVKTADHFATFCNGLAEHHVNLVGCKLFYERKGLVWLYGPTGAYLLDVARQELAR